MLQKVTRNIETLVLNRRSLDGKSHNRRCSVLTTGKSSALNMNGAKLLSAIIDFIARSTKLHTIIIESIKISTKMISNLAKALAVTKSGKDLLQFFCPHLIK